MIDGRFLVCFREVTTSERSLTIKSLLKELYSILEEDIIHFHAFDECKAGNFFLELHGIIKAIDTCKLDHDFYEVVAVVSGYIAKKILKRSPCENCKNLLVLSEKQSLLKEFQYLSELFRGGFLLPFFRIFLLCYKRNCYARNCASLRYIS